MRKTDKNQTLSVNSEADKETGTGVPSSATELGRRIDHLCRELGWSNAAEASDKSVKQLRRYVQGGDPPFGVLLRLSEATGASLEWLATGRPHRHLDALLQERVLLDELDSIRKSMDSEAKSVEDIRCLKDLEDVTLKFLALNREYLDLSNSDRERNEASSSFKEARNASSKSPPRKPALTNTVLDEELHALVVDGIDAVYKEEGARLPPRDLGRLAARIHGDLVAAYDDPDDRKVALKLALQSLRRDLRSAPTANGQSKRQA